MSYYIELSKNLIRKYKVLNLIQDLSDYIYKLKRNRQGHFSQNGEDLFLFEYFKHKKGIYVDVGANHPIKNSNTHLLYKNGWKGINIEPIPSRLSKFVKARPSDVNLNIGVGSTPGKLKFYEMSSSVYSTFDREVCEKLIEAKEAALFKAYDVEVTTLASIFDEYLELEKVDVLSIDTEGFEIEVLNGIDWEQVRIEMIIIESSRANSTQDNEEEADILSFLHQKDYKILKQIGNNSIMIKNSN